MSPHILIALALTMGTGTTTALMSSHWLLAWVGLEMSTLAILPIMSHKSHPRATEATTKYFLIQAAAASLILFSGMTNAWLTGFWDIQQMLHPLPTTILTAGLALKIGLAPLHFWMPDVLQGLSLTAGLILCTWQKIAPVGILLQLQPFSSTTLLLGLVSSLVGGWGGLNQTQLRKLLAYSSIAHLGWMVTVSQLSPPLALLSFLLYMIMTTAAFSTLMLNNTTGISALTIMWAKSPLAAAATPTIFLSLGGLPPLTGFLPKWLILQELTKQDMNIAATLMALSALLSLFFYLRISYVAVLTMTPNNLPGTTPWRLPQPKMTSPTATCIALSVMLLPTAPLMLTALS
ncbi:NADH dehydrogenase subunit 2 (mitochondrion) [Brachionichthys hirsutus]